MSNQTSHNLWDDTKIFKNLGLGGIVCNVSFDRYLQSEDHWNMLSQADVRGSQLNVHGHRFGALVLPVGAMLPSLAILDYKLTMSMPKPLTAATGIDALTHAIEAYVSKQANDFTDLLALDAVKLIYYD